MSSLWAFISLLGTEENDHHTAMYIFLDRLYSLGIRLDLSFLISSSLIELQQLATASGDLFSTAQKITIGIQLIKNLNYFETGLIAWFELSTGDNTWSRFKTHF